VTLSSTSLIVLFCYFEALEMARDEGERKKKVINYNVDASGGNAGTSGDGGTGGIVKFSGSRQN
jgi:hypothetical protein